MSTRNRSAEGRKEFLVGISSVQKSNMRDGGETKRVTDIGDWEKGTFVMDS